MCDVHLPWGPSYVAFFTVKQTEELVSEKKWAEPVFELYPGLWGAHFIYNGGHNT